MSKAAEIRNEISKTNSRMKILMNELSEVLIEEDKDGYVDVMDSTFYLTTPRNVRYYGDRGYEVGDWVPSSETC